ncbi:MAG: PD-(D/E)XK nuclease family protein [Chitinophagaceae bacterium]
MQTDIKAYSDLIKRYKNFLDDWYNKDQSEASRFNLFSILKVNWMEALLHTPFLTELLNPQGTHSQGDLFYKEFIRTILPEKDHKVFGNIDTRYLYIKDEEAIKNGFVDIYIHHKDKLNPFLIIIENKILAGDGDKQLTKYYEYSKAKIKTSEKIRLIYLRLQECMPTEISMDQTQQNELKENGQLIIISYKKEITNWLKRCMDLVKAPKIKYSIAQYLLTLETICDEQI